MKRTSTVAYLWAPLIILLTIFSTYAQKHTVKGEKGYLTVKGDKTYPLNKKVVIEASFSSEKATYLWDLGDLPDDQIARVGSSVFVWAGKGTYTIRVTAVDFDAKKIDTARYTFVVGEGTDPVPNPVDPLTPVDATLLKLLQDAYAQETQADKRAKALTLSYAYKQAVLIAVDNVKLTTVSDLNGVLHDTIKVSMADTELAGIRKGAISKWMKERFPSSPSAQLTPEIRKQFKDAYGAIATALAKVAG